MNVDTMLHLSHRPKDTRIESTSLTWADIGGYICEPEQGNKEGRAWVFARFEEPIRRSEHIASMSLVVLDIEQRGDGPQPPSLETVHARCGFLDYAAYIHTTASHRWRPRGIESFVMSHETLAPMKTACSWRLLPKSWGLDACCDTSSGASAQCFYLPRVVSPGLSDYRFLAAMGEALCVDTTLAQSENVLRAG